MSKRFTDTGKWTTNPAFRKLSPRVKCLWQYIRDNCDNAGVFTLDIELASFLIGEPITDADLSQIAGSLLSLGDDKYWIRGYVSFQCGELSETCKPHIQVITLLKKHRVFKEYSKGIHTLKDKEKEKEKEKEEDKEGDPVQKIIEKYRERIRKTDDSRTRAKKHITKRLKKDKISLPDLLASIDNYALDLNGTEDEFKFKVGNFFGRDERYIAYLPGNFEAAGPKPEKVTAARAAQLEREARNNEEIEKAVAKVEAEQEK